MMFNYYITLLPLPTLLVITRRPSSTSTTTTKGRSRRLRRNNKRYPAIGRCSRYITIDWCGSATAKQHHSYITHQHACELTILSVMSQMMRAIDCLLLPVSIRQQDNKRLYLTRFVNLVFWFQMSHHWFIIGYPDEQQSLHHHSLVVAPCVLLLLLSYC